MCTLESLAWGEKHSKSSSAMILLEAFWPQKAKTYSAIVTGNTGLRAGSSSAQVAMGETA